MDGLSPSATPIVSPALSLTSFESCVSNFGDFQADMNLESREEGGEVHHTGLEHHSADFIHHSEVQKDRVSLRKTDIQSFGSNSIGDDLSIPVQRILQNDVKSNGEKLLAYDSISENVQFTRAVDDSDGTENVVDTTNPSFLANIETDPLIWLPPEPEDIEDDIECSVANSDDDDDEEYYDGTKWAQQSFLSSFDEENAISRSYKEERRTAMAEAMNGQFKVLVSRFLTSEGIPFSTGESGESWLDIVSSLSWEAAMLVKPDANEGKAMDPGFYVKVKCIASGSPSQSQVIKGLVFKKNAAHKHMPTKFKNPRLLLLQGVLGQHAVGLSSFDSMEQEKDYLKSAIEMIDTCHPNVVIVEKTVSRDIQESLLAKGITLVFDMKLHRLERIALCTGSHIISSSGIPINPKLTQCDSFHIEKIVEEHNSFSEGGKRPSKTLMFFEGCPKPLGCTILLKGDHGDELKRVKRVVHYTVFAAYHLIMETSFFADQRAIFSNIHNSEKHPSVKELSAIDIPISDGSLEKSSNGVDSFNSKERSTGSFTGFDSNCISHENGIALKDLSDGNISIGENIQQEKLHVGSASSLLPGQFMSSPSASGRTVGDRLALGSSAYYESDSSDLSFKVKEPDGRSVEALHTSTSPGTPHCELEVMERDRGNLDDVLPVHKKIEQESHFGEHQNAAAGSKPQLPDKDDIENVLDPQSILVLLSSQCKSKRTVCEESHLSRIKYYGNFDMSLGRFLQDVLLNKKHSCSTCNEPPEAHAYYYTHQNGRLTVLVKRLRPDSQLSGEAEGKIWMWTRCLKCEREHGIPRSTRRVVMSNAARGLSFGKFLELSFSCHSAARRISRCGHSLQRDCLRFFGLGSSVAMFIYSSVDIYTAHKPPPVLEFNSLNEHDCLKGEARDVLQKAELLFSELADLLDKIKPRFSGQHVMHRGPIKEFQEVEEMWRQEKSEFEASLLKVINNSGQLVQTVPEMISLPFLSQELLLEMYIWDQRIHSLLSSDYGAIHVEIQGMPFQEKKDDIHDDVNRENDVEEIEAFAQVIPAHTQESSSQSSHLDRDTFFNKACMDPQNAVISKIPEMGNSITDVVAGVLNGEHAAVALDDDIHTLPSPMSYPLSNNEDRPLNSTVFHPMQEDGETAFTSAYLAHVNSIPDLDVQIDKTNKSEALDKVNKAEFMDQHPRAHVLPDRSQLGDSERWMWNTSELRKAYRADLSGGYSKKFESIQHYTPLHLSSRHQLISQDKEWLHFPVGVDGNIMSICDDEISSIIACALASSQDQYNMESISVNEAVKDKGISDKAMDSNPSFRSDGSVASSFWSSAGSFDLEGLRSTLSFSSLSSDELSTSGSEGTSPVDHLSSENLHPEIHIEVGKAAGSIKYSVVCIYAKHFYTLRKCCCPSESAYVSSISRCMKWDAQGGKSKASFAKTLDDRFIIKQIKKAELDSFLKFGPDYFKYISLSLSSGSQTCLAKIFGIYQVRQIKHGKEVRTNLMVMENLLYGRDISRKYDLKGAIFSRYVPDSTNHESVLLDQNFVEDMSLQPIYVGGRTKHLLQRAIWNDTSFLNSINVMDYSLLVGVDKGRHELMFGIIDYLRQYTWDKQLETWMKSSLAPKNALPTVVSPKEYKKRFRWFMSKYFLTVPCGWSSEPCSVPCKFCSNGSSSSSQLHSETLPEKSDQSCA
uniref:1-phosphatidylinositol-3-phosphate 5-kinase n=2 Tax=Anthurium amnicola TaxID=1678845 RepID=A0A1D1XL58_9ARAE